MSRSSSRSDVVRLSVCIQTHPARSELLERLLNLLSPAHVLVAHDPTPDDKPGPLRTYLRALELAPAWSTHHLVLQDDALVSRNFVEAASVVARARPENPVALFCPKQPPEMAVKIRGAVDRGEGIVEIPPRRWAPVVALIWPVELARDFLAYVIEKDWPTHFRADDEAVGRFFRENAIELYATAPSLVEHPDVERSLIGNRVRGGRVAAAFIGDADPLEIVWE